MRARYSAFAIGDAPFLLATGTPGEPAGLAGRLARTRWLRLQVVETERGQPGDDAGVVAFVATFEEAGRYGELRERSRFGRVGGSWRYLDGDPVVVRLEVGRNDPCPCGSGRKLKHCHAGADR
jgi:SEC-C motif-containing protein